MASYVESATLRVIDQSSAPLGRIDAALKRLHATAASMASTRVNIDTSGANRGLETLLRHMHQISRGSSISINVNTTAASRAIAGLVGQMRRMSTGSTAPTISLAANMSGINQVRAGLAAIANSVRRINTTPLHVPAAPGAGMVGGAPAVPPPPHPLAQRYPQWAAWHNRRNRLGSPYDMFPHNVPPIASQRGGSQVVTGAGHGIVQGALGVDRARTYMEMLLTPQQRRDAELFASEQSQRYREIARGDILQLYAEVTTNFRDPGQAAQLVPYLLHTIRGGMLGAGQTSQQAQEGMIQLVRALGVMSRLTDQSGNFNEAETRAVLDAYMRSKIVGGRDISPAQAFQLAKYLKTTGQTLSVDALLHAFIAMPDLRGSTFGNSMDQFVRQQTGHLTKAAQSAQVKAGLASFVDGVFTTRDEELLRSDPRAWIYRHIMGQRDDEVRGDTGGNDFPVPVPGANVLANAGLDWRTATPAQMAVVLGQFFSRATVEAFVNQLVNQRAEHETQIAAARRLDTSPETFVGLMDNSLSARLQEVGNQVVSVLGDIAERLKVIILPTLDTIAGGLSRIGRILDDGSGRRTLAGDIVTGVGTVAGLGVAGWVAARTYAVVKSGLSWLDPRSWGRPPAPPAGGGGAGAAGGAGAIAAGGAAAAGATPRSRLLRLLGPLGLAALVGGVAYEANELAGPVVTGVGAAGLGAAAWLLPAIRTGLTRALGVVGWGLLARDLIRGYFSDEAQQELATAEARRVELIGGRTIRQRMRDGYRLFADSDRQPSLADNPGLAPFMPPAAGSVPSVGYSIGNAIGAAAVSTIQSGVPGTVVGGPMAGVPPNPLAAGADPLDSFFVPMSALSADMRATFESAALSISDAGPVLQAGIEAGAAAGAEMFAARIAEAAASININVAAPAAGANTGANPGIAR